MSGLRLAMAGLAAALALGAGHAQASSYFVQVHGVLTQQTKGPASPYAVGDSVVLTAINTRMITLGDFVRSGPSVALKPSGRKGFFHAYELRMDTLVTHPLFDYRVSYRRLLEIQARLLARFLEDPQTDRDY